MANNVTLQFPGYANLGLRTAPDRAALRRVLSTVPDADDMALMGGGESPGDRLGGIFIWVPSSTEIDDGVAAIKPDDLGPSEPGRWIAIGWV